MLFKYKIKFIYAALVTCLFSFHTMSAQPLVVTHEYKEYLREVKADNFLKMVELRSITPALVYDLRYATKNNFTGEQLYKSGRQTFLRLSVAKALDNVQQQLQAKGLGLKIFDAYRPYSATKKMWELVHDERYVANPTKGSGHNRGIAVDLTVIELSTGNELNMGTGFDNFTDSAHHDFKNFPPLVLQNRNLLKTIMEQNGFKAFDTEWWHYSWPNDGRYDVLDLDFKKLR